MTDSLTTVRHSLVVNGRLVAKDPHFETTSSVLHSNTDRLSTNPSLRTVPIINNKYYPSWNPHFVPPDDEYPTILNSDAGLKNKIKSAKRLPRASIRECAACLRKKTLDQYRGQYSDHCQHAKRTVCNKCVYKHTKFTLANIHTTNVSCPEARCTGIFTYEGIHQILDIGRNKTLFEQYDLRVTVKLLKQIPEFVMCAHPECNSGQLHYPNTSSCRQVTCIKCEGETCSYHGIIWHTGLTCDQYDRAKTVDSPSKKWIDKNTKQCPQCHRNIQKNGGCDHMNCANCGHQFCWYCLANDQLVYTEGVHNHRMTCIHYRPRLIVAIRSRICTIM